MCISRRSRQFAQLAITCVIVFGLAVAQPGSAGADEKLGESAIDSAIDQLAPDEPVEEEAPPAEAAPSTDEPAPDAPPPTDEAPPVEAAAEPTDTAPAAEQAASDAPAADSIAPAGDDAAPASDSGASTASGAGDSGVVSSEQAADQSIQPAGGGESRRTDDQAAQGLGAGAISNVLAGESALGAEAPIAGAIGSDSGGGELRAETTEQGANVRAAGDTMRPAAFAPARNRSGGGDGAPREEGGTVVVNALTDSGDEGKVAVHGHIVAGTLCDGSQFWSLDGGGTVNANGVNLSANGGNAVTDATGGDDNSATGGGGAGNGGSAGASADGGIVIVDSLVTGNNTGNQVSVGDQSFNGDCGHGVIDGGDVTTISNVNISADGGTAIGDASGGDNNIAAGRGAGAGNGGTARASADGGIVIVGSLVLGNNEGNTVNVGTEGAGGGGGGGGGCLVDGGTVLNEANIDISADGGIAIADASGGDDNIALGDDAAAGNGGRARSNADGGLILAGDITAGNNQGNTINGQCGGAGGAGGTSGGTTVYGGDITNQTNLTLSADGGTAIADASGGDNNVALGGNGDDAAAGNGGRAVSNAAGGVIQVGNITTGNNVGNVIAFGANLAPVPASDDKRSPRVRTIKKSFVAADNRGGRSATNRGGRITAAQGGRAQPVGRRAAAVGKLPNTGTGPAAGLPAPLPRFVIGYAVVGPVRIENEER